MVWKSTVKKIPDISWVGSMHEGVPIASENLDPCIKFCTEVLGLKLLSRPEKLDEFGPGAWLTDEDKTIQIHLIVKDDISMPSTDVKIDEQSRHTAWRIKDIGAFRDRLNVLGVEFKEIGDLIGTPQIWVVDPQGFTWEFQGLDHFASK